MKTLCIEGYFENNLGDDLMFKGIIENTGYDEYIILGDRDKITYPVKEKKIIKSMTRKEFETLLKKRILKKLFFKSNLEKIDLAYVGGSLFMDRGEGKVARGKIRLSSLCKKAGVQTFVTGSNLGPIYNKEKYVKNILKFSKLVSNWTVRDEFSYEFLRKHNINNSNLFPDIVLSTNIDEFDIKNEKKVSISVVNYEESSKKYDSKNSDNYYKDIIYWADYFNTKGYCVKLLSFQNEMDMELLENLSEEIPYAQIVKYNGKNILDEIATSEYIIASRFHSAILGALFDKKMVAYSYNNKTKNYLNSKNFNVLEIGCEKDLNLFKKFKITKNEIKESLGHAKKIGGVHAL
ncbi:polysaccharide pyruvyl transferase family protein [uncultured Ilyobacter sp.]|uniref:polysaccharide pyruvyl transferase family protein n=1 Tax=uncultured Ilyobacter sp. TaxID=544433 RepID=UPI002AA6BDA4|nr:polysaccharide pyruvyl transferase family protein [uncultured Ilyobacter sp.]